MRKSPPKTDLSGAWAGVYNYPSHPQAEHFDATLADAAGILTGTTHEVARLLREPLRLTATIDGSHRAGEVRFIKIYDQNAGDDVRHPIAYDGHLSADGTEISGRWTIRAAGGWNLSGTFLMIRQAPRAEEIAEERLATIGAARQGHRGTA